MTQGALDPSLLGQRVIAILETGHCDATYTLATLMALIEHCIENLPEVRPFDGQDLAQPFLGEDVSRKRLRAHGDAIVLNPGIAHGLAPLAGLLEPALEINCLRPPMAHSARPRLRRRSRDIPGATIRYPDVVWIQAIRPVGRRFPPRWV